MSFVRVSQGRLPRFVLLWEPDNPTGPLVIIRCHTARSTGSDVVRPFLWIGLSLVWKGWRQALCTVHPDTVVRWQRERFRRDWAQVSKRSGRTGRPALSLQVRTLIRTLAQANPLWRAPRIPGELKKLGIEVSERTVSRVLRTVKPPPSQTWKAFLQNHIGEIAAVNFFIVPTIRLRVSLVFLVIENQRR